MVVTNRHQQTQLKHSILLLTSRYPTKQHKHMLQNDTVVTEQWWEIEVKSTLICHEVHISGLFPRILQNPTSKNKKLHSSHITLPIPKQNDQHDCNIPAQTPPFFDKN